MVGVPRSSPAELTPGWPDGLGVTVAAEVARLIAIAVRDAVAERGLRPLARELGFTHSTLIGVVEGRAWPSVQLVAQLEHVLGRRVWPDIPVVGGHVTPGSVGSE